MSVSNKVFFIILIVLIINYNLILLFLLLFIVDPYGPLIVAGYLAIFIFFAALIATTGFGGLLSGLKLGLEFGFALLLLLEFLFLLFHQSLLFWG
jgi:hypothetical protein